MINLAYNGVKGNALSVFKRKGPMSELLTILLFVADYFIVMRWVLPAVGVPT
jgi:hypothetical protein